MSLDRVPAGKNLPDEFNVIIEIPMNSDPVKYEVDDETGCIFVDRLMLAAMHYPCNYGYVPQTLSDDGDPVDVLVLTPFPIQVGAVIPARPIGILEMEDEAGMDAKVLAVPTTKIYPPYRNIQTYEDLAPEEAARIQHFFEHYKDLEKGKWVKVTGWKGPDAAREEVQASVRRFSEQSS
ncbi:MAG TPA: inorganic diphosphatase [Burkholderiaceae bacterium]|nr:inorganic diphosphatase [Burkholderiaceae bacterium]